MGLLPLDVATVLPLSPHATTDGFAESSLAVIEPDDAVWSAFTRCHPQSHLLQATDWGVLKLRFGWERRRVAIVGAAGVLAGAQVLFRRRLGVSVAYVPRGPLFAGDVVVDGLLLQSLDRIARRARAVFLRLEPNVLEGGAGADVLHSFLLLHGFQPCDPIQPRSTVHLCVMPPLEQLLAAMSKGHRADIRRATREGVVVRVGGGLADVDAFYAIMQATSLRAGFAIHSRAYYAMAWELFARAGGAARLFLAERDGRTLAAFLVFAWGGVGLYLYSGSTDEGLRCGANHALQWEALQWARAQGCHTYDFWGVPDALGQAVGVSDVRVREQLEAQAQADALYGVFRFKKGFGGQVVRYLPGYDRVYVPPLYALWRRRVGG